MSSSDATFVSPNSDDRTVIRELIQRVVADGELTDDQNIFATGMVNSMVALDIVQFIETNFSVEVPIDDLNIKNFESVNAILNLLASLKNA